MIKTKKRTNLYVCPSFKSNKYITHACVNDQRSKVYYINNFLKLYY